MGDVWDVCAVVYGIRMPMGDLVGFVYLVDMGVWVRCVCEIRVYVGFRWTDP